MRICFITGILLLTLEAAAQSIQKEPKKDPQNITVVTDQEPFFPNGEISLFNMVSNGIVYNEEARFKSVAGDVMLSFDVMPDSSVSNVMILSGPGFGINESVKSYVEKLKFAPAMQSGIKVRMNMMMNFPVKAH
jgi:TonB family protein